MGNSASSNAESIDSVMTAIRRMVRHETRERFSDVKPISETRPRVTEPPLTASKPRPRVSNPDKLPSKIFVLQPYMRVDVPRSKPEIFAKDEKIPPRSNDDSFAVADSDVDPDMLRQMVREVVEEQLRGDLGRQIMLSVKKDILRSLT